MPLKLLLAVAALILGIGSASAQCVPTNSAPNFPSPGGNSFGATSPQWRAYFGAKADASNGVLCAPSIKNLLPPKVNGDAANKGYVDDVLLTYLGLIVHEPVALATPGALPANGYANGTGGLGATLTATMNGALSIDGVAVLVGMRVLVTHEAFASHDGAYVVTNPGGPSAVYVLTRVSDFDTAGNIVVNSLFLVTSGGTQSGLSYVFVTPPPITVGTTDLSFQQFANPLVAGPIPPPTPTTLGGVFAYTAPSGNYVNGVNTLGDLTTLPGAITVNGTACPLGGTCSITVGNPVSITALTPNVLLSPSPLTATGKIGTTVATNSQTGASYAVGSADAVNHNDAGVEIDMAYAGGPTSVAIPAPGSMYFGSGYGSTVCAGSQPSTITPSGGLINNAASISLLPQQCADVRTVGSSYLAALSAPQGALPAVFGVTVAQFGAKCDGSTNDSAAFQAAINLISAAGGGTVYQQPTGHACLLSTGLTLPAGVHLVGAGGLNWTSPIDNVESHWTGKSSWLHFTDATNPGIDITGPSTSVEGFNYWYTQPTPAGGNCGAPCTYSPYSWNVFPYTIKIEPAAGVGVWIINNSIVNASHCVDWEGPSSGVGGIYSGMDRNNFGCFQIGTRFHMIDNALNLTRLRYEMWWYQGNAQWWYAMQGASHVDWDIEYLANPQVSDVEFTFGGVAMKFTDACVTSGFGSVCFAVSHMQASNVSFNEVCQAMTVADATTRVSARLTNTILYTDSTTSPVSGQCARATPWAIDLASDNADVYFDGLDAGFVQVLAYIGGGTSGGVHGQLHLTNTNVQQYSAYAATSSPGVQTDSTGSFVEFTGTPLFYPSGTYLAGALCAGNGCTSNAKTVIGNLEIGGVGGSPSQVLFSNIGTPQAPGFTLGKPAWDLRSDPDGNFYFDRRNPGTGAFIDVPFFVIPLSTAANATQFQITGETVMHGGNYMVPILISALPACSGANAGMIMTVSNGVGSPTYNAAVGSTTGSSADIVFCNNSIWVYR